MSFLQPGHVQCVQSASSAQVRAQIIAESAMNLSEFLQSFCQQPGKNDAMICHATTDKFKFDIDRL